MIVDTKPCWALIALPCSSFPCVFCFSLFSFFFPCFSFDFFLVFLVFSLFFFLVLGAFWVFFGGGIYTYKCTICTHTYIYVMMWPPTAPNKQYHTQKTQHPQPMHILDIHAEIPPISVSKKIWNLFCTTLTSVQPPKKQKESAALL